VAFAIGLLARHANRPQGPEASAPIDAPARIARVWFEAHHQEDDGPAERMIWTNRQGDPSPRVLHEFPREVGWINAAQLVDLDGRGRQLVVVGLGQPLRSESVTRGYERRPTTPANVIALDAEGRPVWGLDLQDELSRPWPDCQAPALWTCNALAAGDLDGRPGDELVAVGHHMREYPSRISIIDPRTATIDHTYWHMGQLSAAEVEADFLGPGRPAIVSWGANNKLDGFNDEPPRRDEGGRAHYDCVSVLMVLDPQAMDGLGPPHTDRMPGLPSATPYAYAYLDLAASPDTARIEHSESRRFRSARCEIGTIKSVTPSPYADAWKALSIGRLALDDIARANLYVDRNLNLVRFQVGVAGAECETPVDWPAVWRPLVQGGRPASLRPPWPATQPSP
jgi:hypothetical protein